MRLKCTLGRTDDRVRVGFVDLLRTRTVEVSFVMQEYYCKPAKEDIFFLQAEDGIRDRTGTGVQTCALPISPEEGTLADQFLTMRLDGEAAMLFAEAHGEELVGERALLGRRRRLGQQRRQLRRALGRARAQSRHLGARGGVERRRLLAGEELVEDGGALLGPLGIERPGRRQRPQRTQEL